MAWTDERVELLKKLWGEGLSASGELSEAAIRRSIAALRICADKIARRGVTRLRCVATEACRRAANGAGFVERVKDEAGINLEIITSGEEAQLAFSGCMPLLTVEHPNAIVFDIGGGSTELGWLSLKPGQAPRIIAWHSMPVGVVTLTEEFGIEAPEGADRLAFYEEMVAKVADHLAPFAQAIGAHRLIAGGQVQILGTSGTVTTLAGIKLGLPRYDRALVDGSYLNYGDVEKISTRLAGQSLTDRSQVPCVGLDRCDLVVSGCALRRAPAERGVDERLMDDARGA